MISAHLSALAVVIPLLAAPLCVVLRTPLLCYLLTVATAVLCVINSLAIIAQVASSKTIVYALGNWAAPWGIEYRIDSASALVLLILCVVFLICVMYSYASVRLEIGKDKSVWFFTALILCFTGLCGIVISGDMFNVFVFLEISSLSSYVLISFGSDRRCLTAALRYLIMGTVAATFYLIGVGLLYALTGTLNMTDLAQRLSELDQSATVYVAFGFVVVGLGIKMAMFPFHSWLPAAYAYAPTVVTAFLAGTATKAAVYVFARMMFTIFPSGFFTDVTLSAAIIVVLGIVGAIVASIIAFFQTDLKSLFAWSSVGQIGYMLIGLGLATSAGIAATFLHLFNHALMKTAVFLAIGCLLAVTGTTTIEALKNAGKRMPWTMAAIVVGGLSLIGVPFTTGFISKWYLVSAAFEQNMWWLSALVLIGSLITASYVWKIVEVAYFRTDPDAEIKRHEAPLALLVPTWVLVIANVFFGINAQFTGTQAMRAASDLLGIPL